MAAHPGLHAVTAAALTTAVLVARRWATRTLRREQHGPSAARAPWRRVTPAAAGSDTLNERLAALHASLLDPALRETDAYLEQYWKKIRSSTRATGDERRRREPCLRVSQHAASRLWPGRAHRAAGRCRTRSAGPGRGRG